jgi:HD-GYP domain-containing protein (c-di-GMP phosphodiesterase class II)
MGKVTLTQTIDVTRLMSRLIDFRSPFTAMHSAGVAASARELATLYGMSEENCLKMEIAGNLHDVGKLRVPNEILEKPGKLTDREFRIIKEHPYYTRLILMNLRGLEDIIAWASYHHEKLNGSGYPFHFAEDRLDIGSQIMAVADIFSAIAEDRPYRKPMSREQAMKVLWENVEKGAISGEIVALLDKNYDRVDTARMRKSRQEGKRYYEAQGLA